MKKLGVDVDVQEFLRTLGPVNAESYASVEKAYMALRRAYLEADPDYRRDEVRQLDAGMDAFRTAWKPARDTSPYKAPAFMVALGRGKKYQVRQEPQGISDGPYPVHGPLFVVTPFRRSPGDANYDLQQLENLVDHLAEMGIECHPAELRPKIGRAIPAVALAGVDGGTAKAIAGKFGSQTVIRWDSEGWTFSSPDAQGEEALGWSCDESSDSLPDLVARRKARRRATAAARASRERIRAERATRLEQGWPPSWKLEEIQEWEHAGGSIQTASAFSSAGWRADEIIGLLRMQSTDPSSLIVPAESAQLQRSCGISLASLVAGSLPAVPDGVVFSLMVTRPNGQWANVVVSREADHLVVRHHVGAAEAPYSSIPPVDLAVSLTEFIRSDVLLYEIEPGTIKRYFTEQTELPTATLCQLLSPGSRSDQEDATQWGDEVASEWTEEEADLPELDGALSWVHRWVRINGTRVTTINAGSDTEPSLVAVRVEPWEDMFVLPDREIARNSWWSESGGAPISWDGGNSLSDLGGGLVLDRRWGDLGVWSKVAKVAEDVNGRAEWVVDWILRCDCAVPAALNLETFDPEGVLSPDERDQWIAGMSDSALTFWLDVSTELLDAIRRGLAQQEPLYVRTREALANPRSDDGLLLAEELSTVGNYGTQGSLVAGDWGDSSG